MQIILARTQGFCAGVARAIETVEQAIKIYGTPLYVYHDIVHNTSVVQSFQGRGVIFVEDIHLVPKNSRVIFSAHGVPPAIVQTALDLGLKTIDATCPLVTKVHRDAVRFSNNGEAIILIGHKGHQEVTGTAGHVRPDLLHIVQDEQDIDQLNIAPGQPVSFITQTTLSVDDTRELILKLRAKFPQLTGPAKDNICYATQNRQDAVKELAAGCDVIIICGSPNSSNSNRLREKGEQMNVPSYIIDKAEDLDLNILNGKERVGISSGASVPRTIVDQLVRKIQEKYSPVEVIESGTPEKNVHFPLPKI